MATLLDARKKTSLPFKSLFIITPPFSQLRHGEDTSQESASQVSFNSSLPFGYHSNLTNYFFFFFHKAYWPWDIFSYFYSHHPYPRVEHSKFLLRFMASEEGFSCLQSLLTCPKHHFHHVSPFPIIYYLKLKYTNMTLTDSFFSLPLCRTYPVTFSQRKGDGFQNHADPHFHPGFAIYALCELNKLYNLSWLQLPHLKMGINNSYLAQLLRQLYKPM